MSMDEMSAEEARGYAAESAAEEHMERMAERAEYDADRAEHHVALEEDRWEQEQLAAILADPGHDEWWFGPLSFAARPGPASNGLLSVLTDVAGDPMLLRRAEAIELRDFLTQAIEGTLPPASPPSPAPDPDDPDAF